jgi:putative SOS response-associated peptidase YedK
MGRCSETCTILTTTGDLLADVCRMPAILRVEAYDRWLDPRMQDVESAVALLKPFDATRMRRYPVSTRVNLVTNEGPGCSAPVGLPATTGLLFG